MAKKKQAPQNIRTVASEPVTAKPESKAIPAYVWMLLVFVFGTLLYINTLSNEYAVDDTLVITSNEYTQKGFAGLKQIFTTDAFEGFFGERGKSLVAGGRYRPLSIASFAIEIGIFGKNHPEISHFINAVLYGLSGMALYALLCMFFPAAPEKQDWRSLPFWITMIWLAHPIHTEAVANIKGRDEVMGMLFCTAALLMMLKYVKGHKMLHLVSGSLLYILALLSKENAITLLAVVPLTLYFFSNAKRKDYFSILVPMFICAAFFLALRMNYTSSVLSKFTKELMNDPFVFSTTSQKYGTLLLTFLTYFKLLILPHPLTHDYYPFQIPKLEIFHPLAILSILINVGLLAYALLKLRSKDVIAYGILFYFITFSIVSQVFFTVGTTMNERFIYLPSLGLAIILGIALLRLQNKFDAQKKVLLPIAAGLICLGYSVKTISRNPDWKNDFTLFSHDVKISTHSAKLNMAYGGALIDSALHVSDTIQRNAMLREAIDHLKLSISIYGDTVLDDHGTKIPAGYSNAYNLLGNAYWTLSRDAAQAEYAYKMAAYYTPNHFDATQNLVVIYNETGRHKESIPLLQMLIAFKPENATFPMHLGDSYKLSGQPDSAILYYQKAALLDPSVKSESDYQIGLCYARYKNDFANGIRFLQQSVDLNDSNPQHLEDLAVAYAMSNQPTLAIPMFRRVLKKRPDYVNIMINLSTAYQSIGRTDSAQYFLAKAQQLQGLPPSP